MCVHDSLISCKLRSYTFNYCWLLFVSAAEMYIFVMPIIRLVAVKQVKPFLQLQCRAACVLKPNVMYFNCVCQVSLLA